jgi:TP901 family phage tail tape measure protein
MAKGRNPLKYSEIFDLSDKTVVNKILADIKEIDKQYNELAKSIDTQSKVMKDSFVRAAEQMIQASKALNATNAVDREAIKALALAYDELKKRQEDQRKNEEAARKGKKDAADSVNGLKNQIQALIKEYNGLSQSEATQAARMKAIIAQVQDLKKQQKALTDELKLAKNTIDAATGSYAALEQETKKLIQQLKNLKDGMNPANKEAQALVKQISENNRRLKEFDATLGIHNRNVGNYAEAFKGPIAGLKQFLLAMAATYIGFQSFQQFGQKVVSTNVEISDSLADVRRTASLTTVEGDRLVESLKRLDTRTSLKGLVDLATIGGQLGVPKAEIVGFVSAIDQLAVSLKGELSGGAEAIAKALGKVNAVFKVSSKEGVDTEGAMLKTGSAILKLGQAGLATGDFLADFAQRMGGVAANAGISLPKVLAYGAVLEELGISAEVSGTAMSQLVNTLAKAPDRFFKVAQLGDATLTLEKFTNLINTDTAAALDSFFKGLNTGGGTLTQFSELVAGLGIKGTRSVSVLSALAKNTDLLEIRTKQATAAFKDGTLATEQFQLKNTNLAAAFEKLSNAIVNTFVNTPAAAGLAAFINMLVGGQTKADRLTSSFADQKQALDNLESTLPGLLSEYDKLIIKANEVGGVDKLTAEEQKKLNDIMNEIGTILPDAITQFDQFGNVVGIAREKIDGLTGAMRENLKVANQSAADQIRKENEVREKRISLLQEEIQLGQRTRSIDRAQSVGASRVSGGVIVDTNENRELIAQNALKQAEAIKKLKDVLLQELSPAEKKVYDQFYGNQKKTLTAAELQAQKAAEVAEAERKAAEAAKAAGVNMDDFGAKGKRVKTEIEKLEEQVRRLENTIKSQAISGKVNRDTLDELVAASNRLEAAQRAGMMAIDQALDPYKALQTEVSVLTEKLQNQTLKGQDTTDTVQKLTAANKALELAQNQVKLAISGTVNQQELLNTQLEIARKELEKEAAAGNISAAALKKYTDLTIQIKNNNEAMQLSILQVTDPMAALTMTADQLKRVLIEQAMAGDVSAEQLEKYRAVLVQIAEANAKITQATAFNPLDPKGRIQASNQALQRNQRSINAISPLAEAGDRGFLQSQRELEAERLRIIMEGLDAEQAQYKKGTQQWEDIETEKTRILADQERLRTKTAEEEARYRADILMEGLQLLATGVNGYFDLQKSKLQAQSQELEAAKDRELQIAGDNALAKEAIEAKYARKQAEIKRKQAVQDKQQALFQIAIETAIGAARAIASSPLTFGMPWLAFVLAQGVLQAALVAARPIPQFYKGTKNAPEGWAIVGEKGAEAIKSRDGSVRMSGSSAHMDYLRAGDIVYTADSPETQMYKRLLEESGSMTNAGRMYVNAAGEIMTAKADYDTRVMAGAIDRLNKNVTVTQEKSNKGLNKVADEVRKGSLLVAQTIKENRPIITGGAKYDRDVQRIADYINYNMYE